MGLPEGPGAPAEPLTHAEAAAWIDSHRAVLDAARPANPFAGADWQALHLAEVLPADHRFAVATGPLGRALLMAAPAAPGRWRAAGSWYASLFGAVGGAVGGAGEGAPLALPAHAQTLELAPLAEADADRWQAALEGAGWWVRRYAAFGNWHQPSAGLRWAEHLAARPPALRATLARKGRRFTREGGTLQLVTQPAEVDAAIDAYEAIYARSWKPPESHPRFIRRWAALCAERGWLRLGLATLGGRPVAAQFWFTLDGRANIFKLAYDDAAREHSAGSLLSALLFQHALDVDRVDEIDYLSGDDAYKADWVGARRQRVGLLAANPRSALGLAVGLRERVAAVTAGWRAARAGRAG